MNNNVEAIQALKDYHNLVQKHGNKHPFIKFWSYTAKDYVEEIVENTAAGSASHKMAKNIIGLLDIHAQIGNSIIDCFESRIYLSAREEENCRKRSAGERQGQNHRDREKGKNDKKKKGKNDTLRKRLFYPRGYSPSPKKRKTVEGKTEGGIGYVEGKIDNQDNTDVIKYGGDDDNNTHGNIANEEDPEISRITRDSKLIVSYKDEAAAGRAIQRMCGSERPKTRINRTKDPGIPFTQCDTYTIILNSVLRRQNQGNGLSWPELKEICKAKALEHKGETSVCTKKEQAFTDRAKTFDPYSNKNKDKAWAPKMRKSLDTEFAFLK